MIHLINEKRIAGGVFAVMIALAVMIAPAWASDREADHNTHTGVNGPTNPDAPPDDPQNDSDCGKGSPVYLKNLSFVWKEIDISLPGRPKLGLERIYNSFDSTEGIFGKGWTGSCEERLVKVEDVLTPEEDGVETTQNIQYYEYFTKSGISYKFMPDTGLTYKSPDALKTWALQVLSNTVRVTKQDGSYTDFNLAGQIVGEVDRNGNAITYTYEGSALTRIADSNGRFIDLFYTSQGFVDYVRDYTNRTWDFEYNSTNGTLTSVTDPLLGVREYEYQMFTPVNSSQRFALLTRVEDETDRTVISVTYSSSTGKVQTYSEGQNVYTYSAITSGVIRKTDSLNYIWEYTLDEQGRKTQVSRTKGTTNPYLNEFYTYDNFGRLTKFIDGENYSFEYIYDSLGRLKDIVTPVGTASYTYVGTDPWPETYTTLGGKTSAYTGYDAHGNVGTITDSQNNQTTYTWNSKGDLTSLTTAAINGQRFKTIITPNNIGLPLTVETELGHVTINSYTTRGMLETVTDPELETITYHYDDLDRLDWYEDALHKVTDVEFDKADRLKWVKLATNKSEIYDYDIYGRLSTTTHFDNTTSGKAYNSDNTIHTLTDRNGHVITYTYDIYHKKVQTREGANIPNSTFTYDGRGLMLTANNGVPGGEVVFTYDGMSRKLSEKSNGYVNTFTYKIDGEWETANIMGQVLSYVPDALGRLDTLSINGEASLNFGFDNMARINSIQRPNGVDTQFIWNGDSRLEAIDHQGIVAGKLEYGFYDSGRIHTVTGGQRNKNFIYDENGHLTDADYGMTSEHFGYDDVGNRINLNAVYGDDNRLNSDDVYSFSYDSNGNRTGKTVIGTGEHEIYTYNGFNQLIGWAHYPDLQTTTADQAASYVFDPLGRRIRKTIDGITTEFVWSERVLVGEVGSGVTRTYIYAPGDIAPAAFLENGIAYYVHNDHLSTPKYVTDPTGSVVWESDQNAFGRRIGSSGSKLFNIGFPGQYLDSESGLYYNYFRNYDPEIGRYVQSDPIGLEGGNNTYIYTSNNPVNAFDLLGLESQKMCPNDCNFSSVFVYCVSAPGYAAALCFRSEHCLGGANAGSTTVTPLGIFQNIEGNPHLVWKYPNVPFPPLWPVGGGNGNNPGGPWS